MDTIVISEPQNGRSSTIRIAVPFIAGVLVAACVVALGTGTAFAAPPTQGCVTAQLKPDANCANSNLEDLWVSRDNLSRINLSGANLPRAHMSGANLSGANLSGATLLPDVDLSGTNLSGANLYQAFLPHANLAGANLSGADLTIANLSDVDLSDANLSGANLYHAFLPRANLTRAKLSGADFSGARWINGRDCAQGSIGQCKQ
ncbi:pentapeptide repeat-containing protein [Rhodococcus jostii]|uniref:pentapeptide repeat-containing protein n=1 Tax=Rhodococcus jostii TaxID=132919 RepID=UPI00362C294E